MSAGKSYCIVGAGLAGLRAADLLLERGVHDVVVLEAMDRVGGRLYQVEHKTEDGRAVRMDLGGQWIGPPQKYVTALASELGLQTVEQYQAGAGMLRLCGQTFKFTGNIGAIDVFGKDALLEKTWERLDAMAKTVPIEDPYLSPHADEWDNQSVASWLAKNVTDAANPKVADLVRQLVTWFAAVCLSVETTEVSFLYFLWWLNTGGGYQPLVNIVDGAQNFWFPGSAHAIAEGLQKRVLQRGGTVQLRQQVVHIDQSQHHNGHSVRVTHRDLATGQYVSRWFDGVIVSVAPALISQISFTPALPTPRAVMYQRMPMGCVIKFIVVYRTPWWREMGLNGTIISDEGPVAISYDKSLPEENFYSIVCFFGGNTAKHWNTATDQQRTAAIVKQFKEYFGTEKAETELVCVLQHDWTNEEFTRGCFMCIPAPGAMKGGMKEHFRQPYGAVHFIGTETGNVWVGYMDGALESSERAVRDIMKTGAKL